MSQQPEDGVVDPSDTREDPIGGNAANVKQVCRRIPRQAVFRASVHSRFVYLTFERRTPGCQGNDDANGKVFEAW